MNRVPPLMVTVVLVVAFALTLSLERPAPASAPAHPEEGAVQAPPGYRVDIVADGLVSPTAFAVDHQGAIYVASPSDGPSERATIAMIGPGIEGRIITKEVNSPVTGLTWHKGALYITHRGAISVLKPATGEIRPLLTDLPDKGDHGATAVAIGPDGNLYFGIGTATNAAVVGTDNAWIARFPSFADLPCQSVRLRGTNFSSDNPLTPEPGDKATTGAFAPFGVPTSRGQVVQGAMPCTGAIFRISPAGLDMEMVAWGLRAPSTPAFDGAGALLVATKGMQNRGSRPVADDPDALYRVEPGAWYGWPDFTNDGRALGALLLDHPWSRQEAVAILPHGAGASAVLFPPRNLGLHGDALVALRTSGTVIRITPEGRVTPFLSTRPEKRGLVHPLDLAAGPDGSVYVLDQGATAPPSATSGASEQRAPGAGAIWRISRVPSGHVPPTDRFRWALVGAVCVCAGTVLARDEQT